MQGREQHPTSIIIPNLLPIVFNVATMSKFFFLLFHIIIYQYSWNNIIYIINLFLAFKLFAALLMGIFNHLEKDLPKPRNPSSTIKKKN